MKLTLTAGCSIKFFTWLAKVICLYNYCNLFYFKDSYNNLLLAPLSQLLLIPNRNMFMDLIGNFSAPSLNQFCWNLTTAL